MRRTLMLMLMLVSVLGLGLVAVGGAAQAAQPLGVEITRISGGGDVAVVRAVCPVDPPTTLFITTEGVLIGSMPVTCTRRVQRFVLPLSVDVLTGGTLQEVTVVVSGDSGEVSAFYDSFVVTR